MRSELPFTKVYLVGIKGAGMTALAQILASHKVHVTGSDTKETFFTDALLRQSGIHFFERFSQDNVPADTQAIIHSTAYHPEVHEELVFAQSRGIPVFSYPEFLGILTKQKLSIAVCGAHGKTTTTALLAHVLFSMGKDPSALVGSEVLDWKNDALMGTGVNFVFEADEYQNKLKHYHPWSLILTNVGYDHPDYFPTSQSYEEVFESFVRKIPPHGWVVVCADNEGAMRVSNVSQRITYGYAKDALYQIREENPKRGFAQTFTIQKDNEVIGEFSLRLFGRHNIQNASGVIAFCDTMGLDMKAVSKGLQSFHGTTRRMEKKGTYKGSLVLDDYAHHPEEIEVTLDALKEHYPNKEKIVVFQPHTFSRTEMFLDDFGKSFQEADAVLLLDIYASSREKEGAISSDDLAKKINESSPEKAANVHTKERAIDLLKKSADKDTIIITMGAGDVWRVGEALVKKSG